MLEMLHLTILMAVEKQQAYSNLLLHQTIEKYTIDPKDRALLTELTYGTLQYKMTLDYYLQPFIKGKLDDWVLQLLATFPLSNSLFSSNSRPCCSK